MTKKESVENEYADIQCGIGVFRPSCLQPLANEKSFIGVFSVLSLISWSFYTVFVSQISNIEKAFGLSSSESGRLLTVWEIGYISFTAIASYFAPRAHIPRVIGTVTICFGLSGLLTILPHFVAFTDPLIESSDYNSTTSIENEYENNLCKNAVFHSTFGSENLSGVKGNEETVVNLFSKRTIAYTIFTVANFFQGASKAPCYAYSAQYVDDNGKKENTGFYMGLISSIAIFGLTIGYGIGSLVSKLYVTLEDVSIAPSDPRFISAWWLGMVVVSILSIIVSFPMLMIPRRIKNKHTESRDMHTRRKPSNTVRAGFEEAAKTVFKILKSPIYMTMLFASSFQALATASFFGFEPKYMEKQFFIPSWKVNIIVGAASIFSFSVGSVLGGYLTKRFKFTPFVNIVFIIIMAVTDIAIVVVLFFIGCPQPEVMKYPSESTTILMEGILCCEVDKWVRKISFFHATCLGTHLSISQHNIPVYEAECNCTDSQFLPICGSDGISWYSPCHAGCSSGTLTEFGNCSQIIGGEAKIELCPSSCNTLWIYVALKLVHNMVDAISSVPIFIVLLRSAGEERKSMAIGLSAAVMSIISWLPGPTIGGSIIDSACVVWKQATSTSGSYCAFYDIETQRYRMHGAMFGFRIISLSFMVAAFFFGRHLKSWEEMNTTTKKKPDIGDGTSIGTEENDVQSLKEEIGINGSLKLKEAIGKDANVMDDCVNNRYNRFAPSPRYADQAE